NACGMSAPGALFYDKANDRLFVSDVSDNRVVVYNLSGGIANGMAASNVLGQPDFVTGTPNTPNAAAGCTTAVNACGLWLPSGLWYADPTNRLYLADPFNSPTPVYALASGPVKGKAAAQVLGQADFTTRTQNAIIGAACATAVNACGMVFPRGVVLDAATKRLFVNDSTDNYRVLVFDLSAGLANGMAASKVLGQSGLAMGGPNGQNPVAGC